MKTVARAKNTDVRMVKAAFSIDFIATLHYSILFCLSMLITLKTFVR